MVSFQPSGKSFRLTHYSRQFSQFARPILKILKDNQQKTEWAWWLKNPITITSACSAQFKNQALIWNFCPRKKPALRILYSSTASSCLNKSICVILHVAWSTTSCDVTFTSQLPSHGVSSISLLCINALLHHPHPFPIIFAETTILFPIHRPAPPSSPSPSYLISWYYPFSDISWNGRHSSK